MFILVVIIITIVFIYVDDSIQLGHFQIYVPLFQFEHAGTNRHGNAHDDALGNAVDLIRAAPQSRLKQVIRGFLERGEHEYGLFHLSHPKSGDAQNFALIRHHVS